MLTHQLNIFQDQAVLHLGKICSLVSLGQILLRLNKGKTTATACTLGKYFWTLLVNNKNNGGNINVKHSATKYPTQINSLQGIFALDCGREGNASCLFCAEAKLFYLQKLPSCMIPLCIFDVDLFFTVLSRANPKDKQINL